MKKPLAIIAAILIGAGAYGLSVARDADPQRGGGDRQRPPSSGPAVGQALPHPQAPPPAAPKPVPGAPASGQQGPSAPSGGPRPRPPIGPSVGQAVPGAPTARPPGNYPGFPGNYPGYPGNYPGYPWIGVPYVPPQVTFGYWAGWPSDYSSYPPSWPGPYPFSLSAGTGSVRLDVVPNDADVYVDGYYAGVVSDFSGTFHHLSIAAGPHVLEFRKEDMETVVVPIFVQPDHTVTYTGKMVPAQPGADVDETMQPAVPPGGEIPWSPPGDLRFDVTPKNAQAYVDGYFIGTVDDFEGRRRRLSLAPGAHHIALHAPGYESVEADVSIESRQTTMYKGALVRVKP